MIELTEGERKLLEKIVPAERLAELERRRAEAAGMQDLGGLSRTVDDFTK